MNLRLGELVQHPSGEIGMIVAFHEPAPARNITYDVEWYNGSVKNKRYRGSYISEYDVLMMRDAYLNFRDWVYGNETSTR